MSLYACEKCGAIENTALGNYWEACLKSAKDKRKLCSECATGKWHGEFPKRIAHELGYYTDGRFIYSPEEVDTKKMVWTYNPNFKIKGLVQPPKL